MALDVNSSLANSLFSGERAAASRAKTAEPSAANGKTASSSEASASFGSYVAGKPEATSAQAAARTTPAGTKKLMPGQIAGHQDTKVAGATAAQGVKEASATVASAVAAADATLVTSGEAAKAEGRRPIGEGESERRASMHSREGGEDIRPEAASGEEAATPQAENAQNEGASGEAPKGQGEQQSSSGEGSGDETLSEPGETAVPEASEAVAAPQPEAVLVAVAVPAVVTAPSTPVPSEPGIEAVGTVGATSAVPAEASLPVEAAQVPPVTNDSAPVTTSGITVAAPQAATAEAPVVAAEGETKADVSLKELMSAKAKTPVAETAKEGASSGIEAKEGRNPNGIQPAAEGLTDGLKAPAHEGPTLRGAIFSQVLEGFTPTHGVMRHHEPLLSVLDATPNASAAASRNVESQQRPTPLQMLPVEIGMQAVRGAREFQIRLDPAELGRVDVKLHINDKGEVNATMIVERPETLQMLRRDAQTLAQAFDQAGLKQGEDSLSFSLRGDGQHGQQQEQQGRAGRGPESDDPALNAQISDIVSRRVMIPNSSLDRMV